MSDTIQNFENEHLITSSANLLEPNRPTSIHHGGIIKCCVPLPDIRRSLSLPRHTPRSRVVSCASPVLPSTLEFGETTVAVLPKDLSITPCRTDAHPDDGAKTDSTSKWRRMRNKPLRTTQPHVPLDESAGLCNAGFNESLACLALNSPVQCCSTSENPTGFHDPILAQLEAELPAPPPPPRARPLWLKTQLSSPSTYTRGENCSATYVNSLPSTQTLSSASSILNPSSQPRGTRSLEGGRHGVRIYPVMQNGVKMSDTHYWLLDPPRSAGIGRQPVKLARRVTDVGSHEPINLSSPADFSGSDSDYVNVRSCSRASLVQLRRGNSEASKEHLQSMHEGLVNNLLKEVPAATTAECQAVLIGCSWDFKEAIRRLKLELLCRKALASRSICKRLLSKMDWDLDLAIEAAKHEKLTRDQRKHQRRTCRSLSNTSDFHSFTFSDELYQTYDRLHKCDPFTSTASPLGSPLHFHSPNPSLSCSEGNGTQTMVSESQHLRGE